jgi:hypothetical protein
MDTAGSGDATDIFYLQFLVFCSILLQFIVIASIVFSLAGTATLLPAA